jgi:hypothetical protein
MEAKDCAGSDTGAVPPSADALVLMFRFQVAHSPGGCTRAVVINIHGRLLSMKTRFTGLQWYQFHAGESHHHSGHPQQEG